MARDMTCQVTSTGRTFSTSRIQRDVIQAHGHKGSNQKSAVSRDVAGSLAVWESLITNANPAIFCDLPGLWPDLSVDGRRGRGGRRQSGRHREGDQADH